jgi:hypothetical protein
MFAVGGVPNSKDGSVWSCNANSIIYKACRTFLPPYLQQMVAKHPGHWIVLHDPKDQKTQETKSNSGPAWNNTNKSGPEKDQMLTLNGLQWKSLQDHHKSAKEEEHFRVVPNDTVVLCVMNKTKSEMSFAGMMYLNAVTVLDNFNYCPSPMFYMDRGTFGTLQNDRLQNLPKLQCDSSMPSFPCDTLGLIFMFQPLTLKERARGKPQGIHACSNMLQQYISFSCKGKKSLKGKGAGKLIVNFQLPEGLNQKVSVLNDLKKQATEILQPVVMGPVVMGGQQIYVFCPSPNSSEDIPTMHHQIALIYAMIQHLEFLSKTGRINAFLYFSIQWNRILPKCPYLHLNYTYWIGYCDQSSNADAGWISVNFAPPSTQIPIPTPIPIQVETKDHKCAIDPMKPFDRTVTSLIESITRRAYELRHKPTGFYLSDPNFAKDPNWCCTSLYGIGFFLRLDLWMYASGNGSTICMYFPETQQFIHPSKELLEKYDIKVNDVSAWFYTVRDDLEHSYIPDAPTKMKPQWASESSHGAALSLTWCSSF